MAGEGRLGVIDHKRICSRREDGEGYGVEAPDKSRAPVGQTRGRGDPRDAAAASEASPPCLAARSLAVTEDGVDGDVRTNHADGT